jgi:hypothetical protein
LAGVATHSRKDFLHVDSCAGICPKIMIGPSPRSEFLFLHHDPIQHTKTSPANTIAELKEGQTVSSALNGTTATNSAPVFWVGPSKLVSSSADPPADPARKPAMSKTAKESSDCDARCAGGCLGTVIRSIHPLRCTKDTLGVHVVVNQTIAGIIKQVFDSVLVRPDSAAEREDTAPMRLTGRVKIRKGLCVCVYGRGGELIHGTTTACGSDTTATNRVVGNPGMEKIGLSTHSINRTNGIDQIAEVVFKVGVEKAANLFGPSLIR